MLKFVSCVIFTLMFSSVALATGQEPDVLIYQGKTYNLFSNPLESFYKNEDERPAFKVAPNVLSSTSNWRGYVATWEIRGDLLYLTNIDSWICNFQEFIAKKCKKADLKEMFGEKYGDGRVLADWFSEELRVPDGKMLEYVHMGYGSVYEREIVISVEKGKVIKTFVIDNRKKKRSSNLDLQRKELENLKNSPTGKRKTSQ